MIKSFRYRGHGMLHNSLCLPLDMESWDMLGSGVRFCKVFAFFRVQRKSVSLEAFVYFRRNTFARLPSHKFPIFWRVISIRWCFLPRGGQLATIDSASIVFLIMSVEICDVNTFPEKLQFAPENNVFPKGKGRFHQFLRGYVTRCNDFSTLHGPFTIQGNPCQRCNSHMKRSFGNWKLCQVSLCFFLPAMKMPGKKGPLRKKGRINFYMGTIQIFPVTTWVQFFKDQTHWNMCFLFLVVFPSTLSNLSRSSRNQILTGLKTSLPCIVALYFFQGDPLSPNANPFPKKQGLQKSYTPEN